MRYLLLILVFVLGNLSSEYTTVIRFSCDETKYGYTWTTVHRYKKEPTKCRGSNESLTIEDSLYMIIQEVSLENLGINILHPF